MVLGPLREIDAQGPEGKVCPSAPPARQGPERNLPPYDVAKALQGSQAEVLGAIFLTCQHELGVVVPAYSTLES